MASASTNTSSYDAVDDEDPMEGIPIPEHLLRQEEESSLKYANEYDENGESPNSKSYNGEGKLDSSIDIGNIESGNKSDEYLHFSSNAGTSQKLEGHGSLSSQIKEIFGLGKSTINTSQGEETSPRKTRKFFSFFTKNSKLKSQLDQKHTEFLQDQKTLSKEFKQPQKIDKIAVDPYSQNPEEFLTQLTAGAGLYQRGCSRPVAPLDFRDTHKPENYTRFVCISDTHNEHENIILPPGDVLIHCGDFTMSGGMEEVDNFNKWLGKVPFKHKIVIAGNHELSFDTELMEKVRIAKENKSYVRFSRYLFPIEERDWRSVRSRLTNCTYLEDSEVTINGIRIWGSPWQPEFGGYAFNLPRGEKLLEKWNKIPGDGIDILMTHGPPVGHSDRVIQGQQHVGCVDLLNTIQMRVQPKYHVFGHIHEDYGATTDRFTTYVNCASVNYYYQPKHNPVVFDLLNKIHQ